MRFLPILFLIFITCVPAPSRAQDSVLNPAELSPSAVEYLNAVRYRSIDTDVLYFDPTRPAPPLDTRFTPPPEPQSQRVSVDGRWLVGLISALVLGLLIWILYHSIGRTSVSFGSAAGNAKRGDSVKDGLLEGGDELPDLEALLRQGDRDQVVVGLAQMVLARCLDANEVLFKRSWTHREALRRLPQSLWYVPDLRALVLASERVNFGHRSISDADFNALLNRVRPILREVRA